MPRVAILKLLAFCVATTVIFSTVGCDSSNSDSDSATAHVQIMLTDAPFPFDLVAEANVMIQDVALKGAGVDSVLLSDAAQPFNLLDLQDGVTTPLADLEVPAGTYNQLRLVVDDSASIVLKAGDEYHLKIPSGSQSGIKILLGNLALEDGDLAQITVDFSVENSFVVQGNPDTPAGIKGFIFKPVVKAKTVKINGEDMTPADQ